MAANGMISQEYDWTIRRITGRYIVLYTFVK